MVLAVSSHWFSRAMFRVQVLEGRGSGVLPGVLSQSCLFQWHGPRSLWRSTHRRHLCVASCGAGFVWSGVIVYSFIRYPDVFLESRIPVKMMIQPLLPGDGGRRGKVAV